MGNSNRIDGATVPTAPAAPQNERLHVHIGSRLRRMFDEVVQEPIPDKFKNLLQDLEQQGPGKKPSDEGQP